MNEVEKIIIDEEIIKQKIIDIINNNPNVKMVKPFLKMVKINTDTLLEKITQYVPEIITILSRDSRGLEILKEVGILDEITKQNIRK